MKTQTAHRSTADDIVRHIKVRRINHELLALMNEQTHAIESTIFVGMESNEAQRCEERCKRIAALVDELLFEEFINACDQAERELFNSSS